MTLHAPTPRLLPLTIVALAAVLGVKSFNLVSVHFLTATTDNRGLAPAAVGVAVVSAAKAAGPEKPPEKAAEKGTGGAAAPAAGSASAEEAKAPTGPPVPEISDSERSVLMELRQRRQALEQRSLEVTTRESALAAAQQRITARVDEMQTLQKQLEALDSQRQEQQEAGWKGLVKLYETMKPRDAATIFNELTMTVLLPVVDRMKEAKAAAILAAMNPDKARDLTTQLAKSRTRDVRQAEPEPPSRPKPASEVKAPPDAKPTETKAPAEAKQGAQAKDAGAMAPTPSRI